MSNIPGCNTQRDIPLRAGQSPSGRVSFDPACTGPGFPQMVLEITVRDIPGDSSRRSVQIDILRLDSTVGGGEVLVGSITFRVILVSGTMSRIEENSPFVSQGPVGVKGGLAIYDYTKTDSNAPTIIISDDVGTSFSGLITISFYPLFNGVREAYTTIGATLDSSLLDESGVITGANTLSTAITRSLTNSNTSRRRCLPDNCPPGCSDGAFTVNIRGLFNPNTWEMTNVGFTVIDCARHECGFGIYQGTITPITVPSSIDGLENSGNIFQVLGLKINKVVRGMGTLRDKIVAHDVKRDDFVYYVMFKIMMGRLLFGEIELKWALTQNYVELLQAITECPSYDNALPYLLPNAGFEQYLR